MAPPSLERSARAAMASQNCPSFSMRIGASLSPTPSSLEPAFDRSCRTLFAMGPGSLMNSVVSEWSSLTSAPLCACPVRSGAWVSWLSTPSCNSPDNSGFPVLVSSCDQPWIKGGIVESSPEGCRRPCGRIGLLFPLHPRGLRRHHPPSLAGSVRAKRTLVRAMGMDDRRVPARQSMMGRQG
jgi:hypothetical protein